MLKDRTKHIAVLVTSYLPEVALCVVAGVQHRLSDYLGVTAVLQDYSYSYTGISSR